LFFNILKHKKERQKDEESKREEAMRKEWELYRMKVLEIMRDKECGKRV
jgi:hypothetical protein